MTDLTQFFIGLTIVGWMLVLAYLAVWLVAATMYLTGLDIIFGRLFSKFTDLIESHRSNL